MVYVSTPSYVDWGWLLLFHWPLWTSYFLVTATTRFEKAWPPEDFWKHAAGVNVRKTWHSPPRNLYAGLTLRAWVEPTS